MAVFAVVVTESAASGFMEAAINARFLNEDTLRLGIGVWFVATEILTTKELTDFLRGSDSANEFGIRSFIVLPVNSYYGMHNPQVWEWFAAKGA